MNALTLIAACVVAAPLFALLVAAFVKGGQAAWENYGWWSLLIWFWGVCLVVFIVGIGP